MSVKIGDFVDIAADGSNYKGRIMPNSSKDVIFLKLESGYNVGINRNSIKSIKLAKEVKKNNIKTKKTAVEQKKGLPKIAILHTGGTLASKVDYETGGVISRFKPEELLDLFPEIREIANIKSVFISNMFSEEMRFENYAKIAKAVLKEINSGVKGIIIGHGTDTMHYTAAALSFMFEHLNVPILIVGAQRSSDRGSSDAAMNLVGAIEFINKTEFHQVAICMHESESDDNCIILPAVKTRKMHTSRRDAFKPINDNAIARVNYKTRTVEILKKIEKEKPKKNVLKIKFEEKVGILKTYPNINANIIKCYKGYKGLIIEGTGMGHMPISQGENKKIFNELKKLVKSGCIVVMTSQCIFGSVNMNVYSPGRNLLDIGIISGEDMLTETAYIKLAWLLGNYKKDIVKELIKKDLRGEIKERILPDEYLSKYDFNKGTD